MNEETFAEAERLRRDEEALRAFLEPEKAEVGTLSLRPITLATLTMLRVTKNEFIAPRGELREITGEDGTKRQVRDLDNELFAALAFGYMHSAPENDVRGAVWSEAYFRDQVMEWGSHLGPEVLPELIAEIMKRLQRIEALQIAVKPKPEPKRSPDDPAPPPN